MIQRPVLFTAALLVVIGALVTTLRAPKKATTRSSTKGGRRLIRVPDPSGQSSSTWLAGVVKTFFGATNEDAEDDIDVENELFWGRELFDSMSMEGMESKAGKAAKAAKAAKASKRARERKLIKA